MMKKKYIWVIVLFLTTIQLGFAQYATKTILLTPTETKQHPVKVVLKSNVNDTIHSTINVKYKSGESSYLIFYESFFEGIRFWEDNKLVIRSSKNIEYLNFIDKNKNLREYSFIPYLKQKHIAEIRVRGKVNYYHIYDDKNTDNMFHGQVVLERNGEILKQKRWFDKKFKDKIKVFLDNDPRSVERLDVEEFGNHEFIDIIKDFNSRKN